MSKFILVAFPSESAAYQGTRALKQLHAEGSLSLYGMAVLCREPSGDITVKQAVDQGGLGLAVGALVGGLVGLIGGPAGGAVGMGAGALMGGIGDIINIGIRSDFLEAISKELTPGKSAVVAEVDEDWMKPLDAAMEPLGGQVIRQWRSDFEDEQIEALVKERRAELTELKDDVERAAADARTATKKRLEEARANLDAAGKRAEAGQRRLEQELEAKLKELQQQLAKAERETKAKIEKRLAAAQAEYKRRGELLKRAWNLTKEALAA